MLTHRRWRCVACRYPVSLPAGTVLHNTKLPLTVWFWAAYLMTTDTRGLSALLLGLRRYETAWMLRHKLRRAMVNVAREPLHGEVEIDDTGVGGPQPGLRGSRQLKGRKAAIVLVAAEKRGRSSGRIRMAMVSNFKQTTMRDFVKRHVKPGTTVYTDGLKGFEGLEAAGVSHVPPDSTAQKRPAERHPVGGASSGPRDWEPAAVLIGTYHGVSKAQLPVYLDEFVFRHNRRWTPHAAFQTLLGLGTGRAPTALSPDSTRSGRPGPSGLTTTCWGLLKQPTKHKTSSRGEIVMFGSSLRRRRKMSSSYTAVSTAY